MTQYTALEPVQSEIERYKPKSETGNAYRQITRAIREAEKGLNGSDVPNYLRNNGIPRANSVNDNQAVEAFKRLIGYFGVTEENPGYKAD